MLRNTQDFRTGSLPARAAATIGIVALIGLAVARARGPTGNGESLKNPSRAAPARRPKRRARQVRCARPVALAGGDQTAAGSQTRRVARARLGSKSCEQWGRALARSPFVIAPKKSNSLPASGKVFPKQRGRRGSPAFVPPPSGIIVRSTKAQDWKSRLADRFGPSEQFRLEGQTCFRLAHPPVARWSAFTSDDRTLVLSGEDTLRDLIQDRRAPAARRALGRNLGQISEWTGHCRGRYPLASPPPRPGVAARWSGLSISVRRQARHDRTFAREGTELT